MRVLRLVPVYVLFLFLAGPILPPLSQATHTKPCCACGSCNAMCTCRGTNFHCPICPGRSPDSSQLNVLAGMDHVDIRAVRTPDTSERLAYLAKVGECARRSFALRILGETGESLKIQAFSSGESNRAEYIAAVQVAVNAER